ncbi:MAG: porin [Bdellovibrionota bacterium]
MSQKFKVFFAVAGVVIFAPFSVSSASAGCAKVKATFGETCRDLVITIDPSGCEPGAQAGVATLKCDAQDNAEATLKTKTATYKALIVVEKDSSGSKSWKLNGDVQVASLKASGKAPKALAKVVEKKSSPPAKPKKKASAPVKAPKPVPVAAAPAPVEVAPAAAAVSAPEAPAPAAAAPAPAAPSIVFSGHIDAYFSYNLNKPVTVTAPGPGALQPGQQNALRNFDLYHNSLSLNRAELTVKKAGTQVGFRLDLNFGQTADYTHTVGTAFDTVTKNIRQALITYSPSRIPGLTITAGKMVTHIGYEVIPTEDNWNYSRSFSFGLSIPYWHNGISVAYPLIAGKVNSTFYIYNGWNSIYENNIGKTLGFQFNLTPIDPLVIYYNLLTGPEKTNNNDDVKTVHEFNATYTVSPNLALTADFTSGSEANGGLPKTTWSGMVFYSKYTVMPGFYLSPRLEFYNDPDGATTGFGSAQKLRGMTLTAGVDLGEGLETRFEVRQDSATGATFDKADGTKSLTQMTGAVGFLYSF